MHRYEWKKYKGLSIPTLPEKSTFVLNEDKRCVVKPAGNIIKDRPKGSCWGLDCSNCIYGLANLAISIDYLVSINIITTAEALEFALDNK